MPFEHPSPRPLPLVLALGCGLGIGWPMAAWAQTPAAPAAVARPAAAASAPAAPASAPQPARAAVGNAPQRVEITGSAGPENQEERRRAIASRIVIGREELDRMGDSSLGEVLKRLPGVTMGGPPGRGSAPRMRGMGGGYTLIMIDGQRMPPGFSLDNIPPEQIERIEVMRAPVAEFSTRAIAGMINVVMRADYRRKLNELRAGVQMEGSRPGVGGNWQRNGQTDDIGWSTSVALMHGGQDNESSSRTTGGVDEDGNPVSDQTSASHSRGTRSALFANGRLQFKLGQGKTLDFQPFVHLSKNRSEGTVHREAETLAATQKLAYTDAVNDNHSENRMARFNSSFNAGTPSGGRIQARLGGMLAQSDSQVDRLETGGTAGSTGRRRAEDNHSRDLSLDFNGKFSQLLGERHSMSTGGELQLNRRNDTQRKWVNGIEDKSPYGDDVDATVRRVALFAQDEWEWNKQLSFYVGARWEAIETRAETDLGTTRNRSSVLTPLAHMVYKFEAGSRDQLRASLTRSYRSPNTNQIIGQLNKSTLYPDVAKPNGLESPDRIGNPDLKPELAWSLELGFERYLESGGLLSVNSYFKRIDNLIRNVIQGPQAVAWATALRYVARPENIGTADTAGLEFEAKLRASELWTTELPLSLRANASLMWSRVSGVAGPDNRIEGQPPWTVNLGGDLPLKGTPLTVGGSWNHTPAFRTQLMDNTLARQGHKNAVDLYALWRLGPEASIRLTVNNLLAQRYDTGTTRFLNTGALYQDSDSFTRTYTSVNLRAEIKF